MQQAPSRRQPPLGKGPFQLPAVIHSGVCVSGRSSQRGSSATGLLPPCSHLSSVLLREGKQLVTFRKARTRCWHVEITEAAKILVGECVCLCLLHSGMTCWRAVLRVCQEGWDNRLWSWTTHKWILSLPWLQKILLLRALSPDLARLSGVFAQTLPLVPCPVT